MLRVRPDHEQAQRLKRLLEGGEIARPINVDLDFGAVPGVEIDPTRQRGVELTIPLLREIVIFLINCDQILAHVGQRSVSDVVGVVAGRHPRRGQQSPLLEGLQVRPALAKPAVLRGPPFRCLIASVSLEACHRQTPPGKPRSPSPRSTNGPRRPPNRGARRKNSKDQ